VGIDLDARSLARPSHAPTFSLTTLHSFVRSFARSPGAPYFVATVVEWFDRYQTTGLDITYPIFQQRDAIGAFGTWSVGLQPVPCPVDTNLTINFHDYSKPYPVSGGASEGDTWNPDESIGTIVDNPAVSLCDNRYDVICGQMVDDPNKNPVGWPKIKAWGSRFPLGDLTVVYGGQEFAMKRSADDFWEPLGPNPGLTVESAVTIRVQCLDGEMAYTKETTIDRVGDCLCKYQDPECRPCETDIQC